MPTRIDSTPLAVRERPGRQRPAGGYDLAASALLISAILAMFWRVVFTHAMFFYRDVFNYTYPTARLIHEICRRGQLPYWNPYLNFGQPLLANPNFLFFYPFTLFIVVLPVDFAYTAHYVIHFAIAAIGTYYLARRWRQSREAAFAAALFFVLSGPVLSLGSFYNEVACAAWIPWALLATDRAVKKAIDDASEDGDKGSLRPWLLIALVFALQFLAGEPFTLLASIGLSVSYAFSRAGKLRQPLTPLNRKLCLAFALAGCFALALSAVLLLPAADLLQRARRGAGGMPYAEVTSHSLHPLLFLEMVIPEFFGPPLSAPTAWTEILSCRNIPYFPSVFVGFVPLLLALVGFAVTPPHPVEARQRRFAASAAALLLLLSLGAFTPAFRLVYFLFPPLRLVRFPIKLLIPALLLVALLAGWGIDALRRPEPSSSRGRRLAAVVLRVLMAIIVLIWLVCLVEPGWIAGLAALVLRKTDAMFIHLPAPELNSARIADATRYFVSMLRLQLPGLAGFALGGITWLIKLERGSRWARRALPLVAALGIAQMVSVNYAVNPTVAKEFYSYRPPVVAHCDNGAGPFRACYILQDHTLSAAPRQAQDFLNFESLPEAAGFGPAASVAFRDRLLLARGSMLAGIEAVQNVDLEGSLPVSLDQFWVYALRPGFDAARGNCLLGRANVKYIVRPTAQPSSMLREVARIASGASQAAFLYQDACFTPRAFPAGAGLYSASDNETLARLSDPGFNPLDQVILPGPGSAEASAKTSANAPTLFAAGANHTRPPEVDGQRSSPRASAGKVDFHSREAASVTLRAELARPGYVVLLDRFDPNWHATVDGNQVAVLRANYMFRAVRASAGSHLIHFYYRQRGLAAGALISLSAVVLLVALYALEPRWMSFARQASGVARSTTGGTEVQDS